MRLTCSNCKRNDNGFCNIHLRFIDWMFEQYCMQFEKKDGDTDVRVEEQGNSSL